MGRAVLANLETPLEDKGKKTDNLTIMKSFYGDWNEIGPESREETPETQSVEEAAQSDGTNEGEELQERNLTEEQQAILFRIKEVLKSKTREALPSLKACAKRIVQTNTFKVSNLIQCITTSNIMVMKD